VSGDISTLSVEQSASKSRQLNPGFPLTRFRKLTYVRDGLTACCMHGFALAGKAMPTQSLQPVAWTRIREIATSAAR
jgi:hypothetical protein